MSAPSLLCYLRDAFWRPSIRAAPADREWMDETPNRFAYRCLPLSIANAHGWEMLVETEFSAYWDGAVNIDGVHILGAHGGPTPSIVHSHFGSGVLTFSIPGMFRTEPEWDLWVMGPINRPKAGVYPLTGCVKTDEGGHTFTMNWVFTDVRRLVRWERHEPFCHFFPVPRDLLTGIQPEFRVMRDEPAVLQEHDEWVDRRAALLDTFRRGEATPKTWDRGYTQGKGFRHGHRTKLRLKGFIDGKKDPA
jgi:hypothetical protein